VTARHALILADGLVEPAEDIERAWPGWSRDIDLVIAADGGARHARRLGLRVDRWVGDGDSVDAAELAALEASGTIVDRAAVDKDETDAELAVLTAVAAGAERITILGALGGERLDHELGNIWLLAHPALAGRDTCLLSAGSRVRVAVPGRTDLAGQVGDVVSLLPIGGDALGITTEGLRYALTNEPLLVGPSRGLSNLRVDQAAAVTFGAGRLLIVETPARL
jgi:thiamine pyrophosphokinase